MCPAIPPSSGRPAPHSLPLAARPPIPIAISLRPILLCPWSGLRSFLETDSIASPPVFIRLITVIAGRVKFFFLLLRRSRVSFRLASPILCFSIPYLATDCISTATYLVALPVSAVPPKVPEISSLPRPKEALPTRGEEAGALRSAISSVA